MIDKIKELLLKKDYKELKSFLAESNEADIAECLDELEKEDLAIVFRLLNKNDAADIFARMDDDSQEALVETLSEKEISDIIAKMYVDDAADLLEELPANLKQNICCHFNNCSRWLQKTRQISCRHSHFPFKISNFYFLFLSYSVDILYNSSYFYFTHFDTSLKLLRLF